MTKMNSQVDNYIIQSSPAHQEIMETIRQLIHGSVSDISEEFKWGRPVFKSDKDFAYLKFSKAYVTLGFFDFEKINDSENRLEGTGKSMRHVKLRKMDDIDSKLFASWFKMTSR